MALQICFSVFDSAIQAYGRPFFLPHRGAALRSFQDECNRRAEDNQLNRHREDFELHQLFVLDDVTGLVTANSPELLLRGKDVIEA